MAAEFHNINFTCAASSIVPSGPGFAEVAYQSCAYAGSKIGSIMVNGDDYLAAQYGFYYSNIWRNFGTVPGMPQPNLSEKVVNIVCRNTLSFHYRLHWPYVLVE